MRAPSACAHERACASKHGHACGHIHKRAHAHMPCFEGFTLRSTTSSGILYVHNQMFCHHHFVRTNAGRKAHFESRGGQCESALRMLRVLHAGGARLSKCWDISGRYEVTVEQLLRT
eukprot:12560092-Alexandrium_andersonii.AAC.1